MPTLANIEQQMEERLGILKRFDPQRILELNECQKLNNEPLPNLYQLELLMELQYRRALSTLNQSNSFQPNFSTQQSNEKLRDMLFQPFAIMEFDLTHGNPLRWILRHYQMPSTLLTFIS